MITFKEYNEAPAVSFDFDDTIYMLQWDDENDDYVRDDHGHPVGKINKEIAQKIKDYKIKGWKVYVITSRYDIWRKETEQFLKDHNIRQFIDEVIFTNGSYKANRCKKYGVVRHFDDDPQELRRLKYKGIEGIQVRNEDVSPV